MNAPSHFRLALLAATLLAAMPAPAANLRFLRNTPIANFTKEDLQIFTQTLNEVLDKGPDGEARRWSNAASGAKGEIKPLNTFERNATPCRRAVISNSAGGRSNTGQYNFCKQSTGQWAHAG